MPIHAIKLHEWGTQGVSIHLVYGPPVKTQIPFGKGNKEVYA